MPLTVFGNNIYGVYYTSSTFEIWRTPNIGATTAYWEQVVDNSLGDPKNNQLVLQRVGGFFGADAYISLAVIGGRGSTTFVAGAALSVGCVTWTAGSWIQAHLIDRLGPRQLDRIGFTLIAASVALMIGVALRLPVGLAASWRGRDRCRNLVEEGAPSARIRGPRSCSIPVSWVTALEPCGRSPASSRLRPIWEPR